MFSLLCILLNCLVCHCKKCNLELWNFTFLSHLSLSVATGSARIMLNGINHFVRASLVKCVGLTHIIQKLLIQYCTALSCGAPRKLSKRCQHLAENPPFVEKLTVVLEYKIIFAIPVMNLFWGCRFHTRAHQCLSRITYSCSYSCYACMAGFRLFLIFWYNRWILSPCFIFTSHPAVNSSSYPGLGHGTWFNQHVQGLLVLLQRAVHKASWQLRKSSSSKRKMSQSSSPRLQGSVGRTKKKKFYKE